MQKNKLSLILIGFILITLSSNLILANPFENIQLSDGFEVIGRELNDILNKNFALLAIVLVALALLFYSIVNTALKKTPIGENKTISWSFSILIVGGIYYKTIPYGGMEKFLDNVLGQTVGIVLIVFTIVILSWLKGNKSMGTPLILASLLIITWYFNQEQTHYLLVAILIIIFVLLRRFNVFSQDKSKGSIYNDKPATFKERRKWFDRTKQAGKEIFSELKKDLRNAEEQEKFIKDTYQKEQVHEKLNTFFKDTTNALWNGFIEIKRLLEHNQQGEVVSILEKLKTITEKGIQKSKNLPLEIKEIKKQYKDWYTNDLSHQIKKITKLNITNESSKKLVYDVSKVRKLLNEAQKIKEELETVENSDEKKYKEINKEFTKLDKKIEELKSILTDNNNPDKTEDFKKNFKIVLKDLKKLTELENRIKNNPFIEEIALKNLYKININIKEILTKAEKDEQADEKQIEQDFKNESF